MKKEKKTWISLAIINLQTRMLTYKTEIAYMPTFHSKLTEFLQEDAGMQLTLLTAPFEALPFHHDSLTGAALVKENSSSLLVSSLR